MIVKKRIKRPMTQKEMAEKFNVSVSTVKNYIALPREEYEQEAKERRARAYQLRESGEQLGTTINGAVALYKRHLKIDQKIGG